MSAVGNVWRFPPHVEFNQIERCRIADGVLQVMFEDGRAIHAPSSVVRELSRVFGVADVNALANLPVEVRSEPAPGFAQLAEDVHIGRRSALELGV